MQAKMILVPILCVLLMLFVAPGSIFAETIAGDAAVTQSEIIDPTGDTPILVPADTSADTPADTTTDTGAETPTEGTATDATTETPTDTTTDTTAEEAGVTPDSWLYSLETMIENVQVAVTFSAEGKAELLIEFANERLAEAEIMSEANQLELMQQVLQAYSDTVKKANFQVMQLIEDEQSADTTTEGTVPADETATETVTGTTDETTTETPADTPADTETALIIENLLAKIELVQGDAEKITLKISGDLTEEQAEIMQNIIKAEVQNTLATKAYVASKVAYVDAVHQFADAKAELALARESDDESAVQAALEKVALAEQYKEDMQDLRKDVQKVKVDVMKDTKEVVKEQRKIIKEQKKNPGVPDDVTDETDATATDATAPETELTDDTDTENADTEGVTDAASAQITAAAPDTAKHGSGNGKGNNK